MVLQPRNLVHSSGNWVHRFNCIKFIGGSCLGWFSAFSSSSHKVLLLNEATQSFKGTLCLVGKYLNFLCRRADFFTHYLQAFLNRVGDGKHSLIFGTDSFFCGMKNCSRWFKTRWVCVSLVAHHHYESTLHSGKWSRWFKSRWQCV